MDVPSVYFKDSNCNTFPDNNKMELIYCAFEKTMTTSAIGSLYASFSDINSLIRAPKAKPITILPGRYKLYNPIVSKSESYTTAYGAEFEFYNSVTDSNAAYISGDKAIWKGGTFHDKSSDTITYGAMFLSAGGTIEDASFYGFYRNGQILPGLDCEVFLRRNTFGRSKSDGGDVYNVAIGGLRLFCSEGNTYYPTIYSNGADTGQGVMVALYYAWETNNISFDKDFFIECGLNAITISRTAHQVKITNCTFDRCGRSIDLYRGDDALVMRNLVLSGKAGRTPINIQAGSIRNRVIGNTIYTLATNGIVVASNANNVIAYNNISAAGAGVSDTSAGTTNTITGNWSGNLWPVGGYSYDTGTGDLNGDGIVNFEDYAIFARHWLEGVGQ